MKILYKHSDKLRDFLRLSFCLAMVLLLGTGFQTARAQSGPYGFEWIVPGQKYAKIKIWRDGIYRLDQQYLARTGLPLSDPSRLQLWRRGREVAVYMGGNTTTVDATTYLEFFGQRNDGKLDAEYYKNKAEQPHQLYSFDTDTAAYFLTYAAQPGRRVSESVGAAGTLHPHRMVSSLKLHKSRYKEKAGDIQQPWLEGGEGFMSQQYSAYNPDSERLDTLFKAILPFPQPYLDAVVVGANTFNHTVEVYAFANGAPTVTNDLGDIQIRGLLPGRHRALMRKSDINSSGNTSIRFGILPNPNIPKNRDFFRIAYYRITAAQANRWYAGRSNIWFQNDSTLAGPAAFELDSIPATVVGYDIQDPYNVQRVLGTPGAGRIRRYVFPQVVGNQTRQLLLSDLARPLVPGLPPLPVAFRTINPAAPDYIIITHPKLMKPAGDVPNAARAYAEYRASAAGGGHDTLMVTSGQLFDQFHYGEKSVLALRRFALWMADNAPAAQTRYLLLLGQALGPNEDLKPGSSFFDDLLASSTIRVMGDMGLDLVPTTTRAASDNFLSSDWPNDNYVPRLPTGRVAAKTAQEVLNYLNKLKEYERPDPDLAEWHKRALNLVGGKVDDQNALFTTFLDAYKRRIERPLFGGRVVRTYNRRDYPQNVPVIQIDASAEVNPGLGLITYFGHGSNTTYDLNLGLAANYNNKGKYPLLFINGCDASRLFVNSPTFGEGWLMTPERGAVGLMGQTSLGFANPLHYAQDELYRLMLNDPDWYGKPVSVTYGEMARRLQQDPKFTSYGEDLVSMQLLSTLWHGDPVIKLFTPAKPDFIASDARLAIVPASGETGPVEASSKSFVLNIGVSNPGKVTTDSIEIKVTRRIGSNGETSSFRTFRQAFRRDTTYAFTIQNEGDVFGQNTFTVELDYRNKVSELSETNNRAQTTFNFLRGGVTLLSPQEFAIVATNTPLLVAQTNDATGLARAYEFELDTVPTFNGATQRRTINGALTAEWQPTLPTFAGRDSMVWYWRVRFAVPGQDEDNRWAVSSFRHIPGSPGGWSQSHYGQFKRDELRGVSVAAPTGRWSFTEEKRGLSLRTTGGGAAVAIGRSPVPTFTADGRFGIAADGTTPPYVVDCAVQAPGMLVAVYDQRSLLPIAVAGGPYLTCGRSDRPFYMFGANPTSAGDTLNNLNNSAARQADFVRLLTNVPDGAYVALVSMNRLRYAALPANVRTALSTLLGSQLIAQNQLRNGDPFTLLAQKRASGGRLLSEAGPDLATGATLRATQAVSLTDTLRTGGSRGTVVSTRIGPAQSWGTLTHTIRTETATGSHTLRVVGYDAEGRRSVLLPSVTTRELTVSTISATQYPYLQLELDLVDAENRVPPQLEQWLVTYSAVPEGVVRRDLAPAAAYDVAALTRQAINNGFIEFPVVFQNISSVPFGAPLQARVSLRNEDGTEARTTLVTAPGVLLPGTSVTFPVRLDVQNVFGKLTAQVEVNPLLRNPNVQPELYHFNNTLTLPPITLVDRNVAPVLDVAFDGRRILSGELVSPAPIISIQLRDEDQLRHIRDTRYFTVTLQRPKEEPTPINLTGDEIIFRADSTSRPGTTATLEFRPGKNTPLPDGMYTLRVQGRDPGNLTTGTQDYTVQFEVDNRSAISNVYPYPNPVTSKARFVFTVTGQKPPRNMKIQIMTLTGKVVRELLMNELFAGSEMGAMHIGNNITDYAWDGTDQYGDRLANGTYLYRVTLDEEAGTFERRKTAGDQAFKKDWGKLVLLR